MEVDFTEAITALITGLVGIALWYARSYAERTLKVKISEKDTLLLHGMVNRAISFGVNKVGRLSTDVSNDIAREAFEYLAKTSPAMLQRVTEGDPRQMRTRIEAEIWSMIRRLPEYSQGASTKTPTTVVKMPPTPPPVGD